MVKKKKKEEEAKKVKKNDVEEIIDGAAEIVFSFDTTGSMACCIADVRRKLEATCESMFDNIKDLRVGFIAHGDYCDGDNCINTLDLTDDQGKIFDFIRNTPNTSGGDHPECYELVLSQAKGFSWSDKELGKALVLIGDAEPHPPSYPQNTDNLDWKEELAKLKESGVSVYGMQCLNHGGNFWSTLSELADTPLLRLTQTDMNEGTGVLLGGIASAVAGPAAYDRYEAKLCSGASFGTAAATYAMSDSAVERNKVLRSVSRKHTTKAPKKE